MLWNIHTSVVSGIINSIIYFKYFSYKFVYSVIFYTGGIEHNVNYPQSGGSAIGGVFGTIVSVGLTLLPMILELSSDLTSGTSQSIANLKPQIDTQIKQMDNQLSRMKKYIDTSITKLTNTTNQTEYSRIYEPLVKEFQAYQHAANLVNRIKIHANNNDFQSVANELKNFVSKSSTGKSIITNPLIQNVITNLQKNFYNPNGMTLEEKVVDNFTKVGSKIMPVAGANLQNAMQDFKYANKNPHAHTLNSRVEITNQNLNKLLDNVKIPKNSRGVIYDNNSEQSKLLWQSPEIQDFLRNNLQDLISNNAKEVYDIEFINRGFLSDNYYGLQHCKLFNPQITPDGYFNGIIVDYYDFAKRIVNGMGDYINNWGYSMQEKGFLENIFNVYIIFEKL